MPARQIRAAALMTAAAVVIGLTAAIYLRSSGLSPAQPAEPAALPAAVAPDRSLVSGVPLRYDFVTPSLGWAVENPVGPVAMLAVFNTQDGGRHWAQQLLRRTSSPEIVAELDIQFLDRRHGFVVAGAPFGELYATSNGGQTWTANALPPDAWRFDGLDFGDPGRGWLLGRVDQRPVFYSTVSAGAAWSAVSVPGDASGLSFRDATEGWLGSFSPDVPHVYVSAGGAATWQLRDLPRPPGGRWDAGAGRPFVSTTIQVLPDRGVVAVVDGGVDGKYEFTSFDRGATWTLVPNPPGRVGYQDSLHWWAMQTTSLFKSADAGRTWTEVTSALPAWQASPEIIDPDHAWSQVVVDGGYGLATSADGGVHWTRSRVPAV